MFDLGIQELIVIFVVALLVFGPKRLPELGRTLGKGILELKKAMEGVKEQIQTESDALKNHHEPEERKDSEGALPDASYPPYEGPGQEAEEERKDPGTAGDTAGSKTPEAGKEDKADGR
jgi:TatA/E family protein of Tat protein translocase